jgi:cation-transporting ATPase 13A1
VRADDTMAPLVDNPQIAKATLHNPLPLFLRTYILPFTIIWPLFFRFYRDEELYNKHIGGPEWTFFWSGIIITLQSLAWLSTFWNVNIKALFTTKKAKNINEASLIKVHPVENAGVAEICRIERDNVSFHEHGQLEWR